MKKTNETYFRHLFSTFFELMVAAAFGKNQRPLCQIGVMVSDSFAFRETKNCRQHALLVLWLTLVTKVPM